MNAMTDVAISMTRNLRWMANRGDIVVAATFAAYRPSSGQRIGVFDCYLTTMGEVEIWEDLGPDDPTGGGDAKRADPEWMSVLRPMFRAALEKSLEPKR